MATQASQQFITGLTLMASVLKKRFKRPINRPLKYFRPETEQNLKKTVGLLGQAINSLKR